jgi:hypothetical protein
LADLLDEIVAFVRRYVVFDPIHGDTVALWTAHTYVVDSAPATPYVYAYSPEPGSGKTTLLDVLAVVAANALQIDNLTEAVLFRLIAKMKPTLLIDEVDAIFGKQAEFSEGVRQVLNSGYRRGKLAYRCVPPSHDVVGFDVFCAKAMAGLNQLPLTLAHRSIRIVLKPPRADEEYEDFDHEDAVVETDPLVINLRSWADQAGDSLREPRLKPAKLPDLDARSNEVWRILFRIADLAGRDWPDRARHAAVELSGTKHRHHDESTGVQLLGHIRELFDGDRMTCGALVQALNTGELLPYGGWNADKGITSRELGKKLARYGVIAKPIRIDGRRAGNGYDRDQFEDAWSRYFPDNDPSDQYTGTTRTTEPYRVAARPVQAPSVPVSGDGGNAHEQSDVPVVPLSGGVTETDGRNDNGEPAVAANDRTSRRVSMPDIPLITGLTLDEALRDHNVAGALGIDGETITIEGAGVSRNKDVLLERHEVGPHAIELWETPFELAHPREPLRPARRPAGKVLGVCLRCETEVGDNEWTFGAWDGENWKFSGRTLPNARRLAALRPLLCCDCAVKVKFGLITPPVPVEGRS